MRRILTFLGVAVVAVTVALSVWAVEKKEKPPSSQPAPKPATVTPGQSQGNKSGATDTKDAKKPAQASQQKKYDDFVDANHNGIDDRKENLKKKDGK